MKKNTDRKMFEILDSAPIEVSSLAPVPFRQRLLGPIDFDSPQGPAARIAAVGTFLKSVPKWRTVTVNLPWDANAGYAGKLAEILSKEGLAPGCVMLDLSRDFVVPGKEAVAPYGSLASPDEGVREAAYRRVEEALEVMRAIGGTMLVLHLPDGWDSPAQASFFETALHLEENLMRFYTKMRHDEFLLITCGSAGPGRYSSAIFNSGRAREICGKLGMNARILLNSPSLMGECSIEQTMAFLLRSDSFGGVRFSGQSCFPGAQLSGQYDFHGAFRMAMVLLEGEHLNYAPVNGMSFILDRFTNTPDPFPEIESMAFILAESFLKASSVDFFALAEARKQPWTGEADRMLKEAFMGDVSKAIARYRSKP